MDHPTYTREGREEVRNRNTLRSVEALAETLEGAPNHVAHRLRRATKTGALLTVQLSTVNRTELGAQEWQDFLFLQYGVDPPDLPNFCKVSNFSFSICHYLDCKKGGIVTVQHN